AKTLRAALDAPLTIEGVRMPVGSSVGISIFPDHGDDPLTLLRRADIAMYVAKRRGTGIALYEEGSDLEGAARLGLASDLREALDRGDLHLHYQPGIDLTTKRVCMMEARALGSSTPRARVADRVHTAGRALRRHAAALDVGAQDGAGEGARLADTRDRDRRQHGRLGSLGHHVPRSRARRGRGRWPPAGGAAPRSHGERRDE